MLKTIFVTALFAITTAAVADPMYIGQTPIDMRQSQCIDSSVAAMERAGMFSIEVVGGITVFSSDKPYYAAISCLADKGVRVMVISGPEPGERVRVYKDIDRNFDAGGWRRH